MNAIGAGLMDAVGLDSLVADVSALLSDADAASTVTYESRSGTTRTFDAASGTVAYTETPTTLTAYLSDLALTRANLEEGAMVGDVQLLATYASLTTAPAVGDRFLVGSIAYAVYAVTRGPLNTHYVIKGHRVQ